MPAFELATGITDSPNREGNLCAYLRTQQSSFNDIPFNAVDSLVLSTLAYLNYECYPLSDLDTPKPTPLIDVLRFTPYEPLLAKSWMKEGADVPEFLDAVARSLRYKDLSVCLFARETSSNIDKQFCAVTFTGGSMPPYIAFRGTDGSVAGWKEDFDLAYKDVLPSHTTALRYLSGVLSSLPNGAPVCVGGHSKGGNLAEYAAASIDEQGFSRIEAIYNHDGPGFLNPPSPRFSSKQFREKRNKTIPESSVFGMILEPSDDHRIVCSSASTIFQHRPLTWLVSGNDFCYQEELNRAAKLFDTSLDAWLRASSPEQREVFLTAVFSLIESTEASTWEEFQANMLSNIPVLFKETRSFDEETREIIFQTIRRLGEQVGTVARGYLSARLTNMLEKLPAKPGTDMH